ncbi:MAG: hypothetical protein LBC19_13240, partial [Tannerella sp.]|nr:hypothetical protein [Tannerella sp.]
MKWSRKNNLMINCLCLFFLPVSVLRSQTIDFSDAVVWVASDIKSSVRETLVRTLQEEVNQRTNLRLPIAEKWTGQRSIIAMVLLPRTEANGIPVPLRTDAELPEMNPEGFRMMLETQGKQNILWLMGKNERGLFYAVGEFLRKAEFAQKKICLDRQTDVASSPVYPIRGHQLGYRNVNNTCDAWTVEQFEKYIRELVLAGNNSIENVLFDDVVPGLVRKLPKEVMDEAISRICDRYDTDYWVWTPANADLSNETLFREEAGKHETFYKICPRLNHVFVPGGDPGNNHPKHLMPFLKEIAAKLKQYHPQAGVWLSLQGFNDEKTDYVFRYIEKHNPDWLRGIVSGPQSPDMAATRYQLPIKYQHRSYPDITHNLRCQYPAPEFDQSFALTLGREACNPQPVHYAAIHRRTELFTDGSVTYSEGNHDDVNKYVWSRLDWNPDADIREILVEYARLFFGTAEPATVAEGILALERNWFGPVEANGSIAATFHFWKNLEAKHPEMKNNWRWLLLVMRSYYDYYTQQRKFYEQQLEKEATAILRMAETIGADNAMEQALAVVRKADTEPVNRDLSEKIHQYCERLYQLVGLQTSVEKYSASGAERGCILDFINYPLNNRWWLEDEFNKIKQFSSEREKSARLKIIANWTEPGEGSFYDNVSDISQSPHVITRSERSYGYAWW